MFARWFASGRRRRVVAALYVDVVTQARSPGFYGPGAVPDTLDGRFDMIVLHAFLVIRRLRDLDDDGQAQAQALFDYLLSDMDLSLRESGVGDLSVGKHVKRMAKAFYGRSAAYGRALDRESGGEPMQEALARNLFRSSSPSGSVLDRMADYIEEAAQHLTAIGASDLLSGRVTFPSPPTLATVTDPEPAI